MKFNIFKFIYVFFFFSLILFGIFDWMDERDGEEKTWWWGKRKYIYKTFDGQTTLTRIEVYGDVDDDWEGGDDEVKI